MFQLGNFFLIRALQMGQTLLPDRYCAKGAREKDLPQQGVVTGSSSKSREMGQSKSGGAASSVGSIYFFSQKSFYK
jgi:hypothetical protein